MSELVDRLRRAKGSELLPKILLGHKNAEIACLEAANRIEQLEQELAAEKALADRFAHEIEHSEIVVSQGLIDYRKARGL